MLTARWTPLRAHAMQHAYWWSPHRFNVVPAGRRSGKTELAKRKLIKRALAAKTPWSPRFFAAAPTREQAKRIYWDDLKALIDPAFIASISESSLTIKLITGAEIVVLGMDKPERAEGQPWDGGIFDEFGNMKAVAWTHHMRPALSDRLGWCDLIGVPEGRNHYYELYSDACAQMKAKGAASEWGAFTWKSADILPASEIEAARRDLDELTYAQEYEASFVNFEGRAYYAFTAEDNTAALKYDPLQPLDLMFDFNVAPGVCAIGQEQRMPGQFERDANGALLLNKPVTGTGIIDEVYIPRNSNTPAVCRKIIEKYGKHAGRVVCYGDATGGNRGSAKVQGSDWDLIKTELRPVFGERLLFRVKDDNPRERARINAVNTRCMSRNGTVRLMVDPVKAPHVVKDFEGVTLLEGGSGEIDKDANMDLSHLTDAVGYRVEHDFPVIKQQVQRIAITGA